MNHYHTSPADWEKSTLLAVSFMEFRLTYDGELPSGNTSHGKISEIKHRIRKFIHPQLRELWFRDPALRLLYRAINDPKYKSGAKFPVDYGSVIKDIGEFRFVPLVCDPLKLVCHLDILFMRNEHPHSLILRKRDEYGGDIDNRLKIFFDALRRPNDRPEWEGLKPEEDEKPFFCLLDDDCLITKVQVDTDTLLGETNTGHPSRVRIITKVTLRPIVVTHDNLPFIG